MKNLHKGLLIFIFFFIALLALPAQNRDARLLKIDQDCQRIREQGYSAMDTIMFSCADREEDGWIRYYFQGTELRYVEFEIMEWGQSNYFNYYYVDHDLPIYVRTVQTSFGYSGTEDSSGNEIMQYAYAEHYFYAENGNGIYCAGTTYRVPEDSIGLISSDDFDFTTQHCSFFNEFILSDFKDLLTIYEQRKKKYDCPFEMLPPK